MMGGMSMPSFGSVLGGYMYPENTNGSLHFTSYNMINSQNNYHQDQSQYNKDIDRGFNSVNKPLAPPSFFANRVVKPIRGGGKKKQVQNYEPDPYTIQNSVRNKEYENVSRKVINQSDVPIIPDKIPPKPLPVVNPFTPVVNPLENKELESLAKLKSIKQIRNENKKTNYLNGLMQAQKLLLDDSLQIDPADESINLDPGSDSDEEDNADGSILAGITNTHKDTQKPIFPTTNMMNLKSTMDRPQLPSKPITMTQNVVKTAPVAPVKQQANAKEQEKPNPFKPKKGGFASTLSKAFKNLF